MKYVALLRGINVGKNARVDMTQLKKVFEQSGCKMVSTYINSGNVIFDDNRTPTSLIPMLHKAIKNEFGFTVPLILREQKSIQNICQKIPLTWTNDTQQKNRRSVLMG